MDRHRHDLDVQGGLARVADEIGINGETGNPGQPVAGKDEWPAVSVLARHARVNKDVLELSGAATTQWSQPQAGLPVSDVQTSTQAQMRHLRIITTRAASDVQLGGLSADR